MKGNLAVVLHAHLPYVYHPDLDDPIEEHWLFEAMTDTYIPLLLMFIKLREDNITFQLTMSLSPSLLEMLSNPVLMYRYVRRLDRLIDLADRELHRTKNDERLHFLALWYKKRILHIKDAFLNSFEKNIPLQFKKLQDDGYLEVLGSTATHGYLPLLSFAEGAVQAQIKTGIDYYESVFKCQPAGIWLPECGYYEGLEKYLFSSDISYCVLETHGITRASPTPENGIYEPIVTENGIAFLGRDPDSSRLVWSTDQGYPADFVYREFYRDIAYDLDFDHLYPFISSPELRIDTGFKYYKITGHTEKKDYYEPDKALEQARVHASDFVAKKIAQIEKLTSEMDKNPIIVAPFDAELFGHWWGEGVEWLDSVIRQVSKKADKISLVSISAYLNENSNFCKASPALSSWGENGYNKTWLNEKNEYIYRHIHHASIELRKFVLANSEATGIVQRCLQQAARELLLAQASDWPFMIGCETNVGYGSKRVETHIININRLFAFLEKDEFDEALLVKLESLNPIFKDIDYKVLG